MPPTESTAPRVLHSMLMATRQPGIYQQMAWEQEAASAEGLSWDVRIFTSWAMPDPAGIAVPWSPRGRLAATRVGAWLAFRRAYYAWLSEQALEYDVVLVRHSPHDPLRPGAVKKLAGRVDTVGTVHHTLDVPELRTRRPPHTGAILSAAEALLGPRSLRWADVIIGVTPEITAYEASRSPDGKPMLVYPNGALVTGQVEDQRADVPELLIVAATFQPWHGLDLFLDSLAGCSDEFTLHVVGNVDPQVSAGCTDPRVVFHGVLDGQELRQLMARAWVGISSLALERQAMTEASPLKVREYLSQGLPVYAGHCDVIPSGDLAFRTGPADVTRIIMFARETRDIPKQAIRAAVVEMIDKRVLVRDLYTALSQIGSAQEK